MDAISNLSPADREHWDATYSDISKIYRVYEAVGASVSAAFADLIARAVETTLVHMDLTRSLEAAKETSRQCGYTAVDIPRLKKTLRDIADEYAAAAQEVVETPVFAQGIVRTTAPATYYVIPGDVLGAAVDPANASLLAIMDGMLLDAEYYYRDDQEATVSGFRVHVCVTFTTLFATYECTYVFDESDSYMSNELTHEFWASILHTATPVFVEDAPGRVCTSRTSVRDDEVFDVVESVQIEYIGIEFL